ncbi:MAG TPA: nitrogen fixation protein NifQ [Polyangiaceae bacterium]|nr:nitrogen fixation protein NifQ [Polyangiaceae bacterium]
MTGANPSACSGFDAHVLACTLALTAVEGGGDGRALLQGLGLDRAELLALVGATFPHAAELFARTLPLDVQLDLQADELCLRELLTRGATERSPLQLALAFIIARRCQRPNHLWQDLGLRNRRELSWLMERHFQPLAQRNTRDMKWKKYLYRVICRDEGFALCTAPSCSECSDFEHCFGGEDGESLLARARRDAELGVASGAAE